MAKRNQRILRILRGVLLYMYMLEWIVLICICDALLPEIFLVVTGILLLQGIGTYCIIGDWDNLLEIIPYGKRFEK